MAWIILEGLDRTGKSTVAELYKERGFEVVHMSAPDKKYMQPGYTGPGYVDELMSLYLNYSGKDVVFDRSPYGEFVWPEVYGRQPQLSQDDLEALIEIEDQNQVSRILMYDKNVDLHWKRCVENNEPMDRKQFIKARALFERVSTNYNFDKKELTDFLPRDTIYKMTSNGSAQASKPVEPKVEQVKEQVNPVSKLERANAINSVLAARIIKKKGDIYDALESDVRNYLTDRLNTLLGGETKGFTDSEVRLLKLYCQRMKDKLEGK